MRNSMKKHICKGFILALVFANVCCQFNSKETQSLQGLVVYQPSQPDSMDIEMVQKHVASCDCEDSSSLIVETLYKVDVDAVSYYKLLVLGQNLRVIYGEDTTNMPLPFFDTTFIRGKDTLTVKKTALYEVKCIPNTMKQIYSLSGIHWFDPPHEFFGLCSTEGKWLWYYYGSMHESFKKYRYGDYEKYEQEFGEEINSLKNMTPVLPGFY